MRTIRRIVAVGAGVVIVAAMGILNPNVAWADAYGCVLQTPNVHRSTHSGGTRLNFVPVLTCASAPKAIGMGVSLQRKSGSSWVNVPWTTELLDNKAKYIRISLSLPCTTVGVTYRGGARKKIDGVWSGWQYSNSFTPTCQGAGGGGGGGGGGSWSIPQNVLETQRF